MDLNNLKSLFSLIREIEFLALPFVKIYVFWILNLLKAPSSTLLNRLNNLKNLKINIFFFLEKKSDVLSNIAFLAPLSLRMVHFGCTS